MKKTLHIMLILAVAISTGASVTVSHSCGMAGCHAVKNIQKACCCKSEASNVCLCKKKTIIKKIEQDRIQNAVKQSVNLSFQVSLAFDVKTISPIHELSFFNDNCNQQKIKPDHHTNTPLLI